MPLIESQYREPLLLSNGHVQTLFPTLFRRPSGIYYRRERISTPDEDFLDLDWTELPSPKLAILSHGLGGDSYRPYILGMVKALTRTGWNTLAWNGRGLGGEINRSLRMTHSGATEDLHTVLTHAQSKNIYSQIALIGFSLGGNITLKYLGERGREVAPLIQKAIVFSVPIHLESTAWKLSQFSNKIYMKSFLKQLHQYVRAKMRALPGQIDDLNFHLIKTFKDFDDRYVAPVHGFKDALDYWRKSSADQVLENIQIPTLMVNAKNDPFLTPECFPREKAFNNPNLFLEIPDSGGHVGFVSFNWDGNYWSEERAILFLNS